jgi:uncharacterized Zn-binding protein involved in type VI secretion
MRSTPRRPAALLFAAAFLAATAAAAAPAARTGDRTNHGGTIMGPASPNVFIQGEPAARFDDTVVCPLSTGGLPHVGGRILFGSGTVLINGRPAARAGDSVAEQNATSVILSGAEGVQIGP